MKDEATIVGFMGAKESGKTTSCLFLEKHYAFSAVAFADPLYDGLGAMFGTDFRSPYWQSDKNRVVLGTGKTLRQLLQTLGTEWGRDLIHPNVWVQLLEMRTKALVADLHAATKLRPRVAIQDVRFGSEIQWIKENGVLVYITNPNTQRHDTHRSEHEIDKSAADYVIENSGSKTYLYAQLKELAQTLKLVA